MSNNCLSKYVITSEVKHDQRSLYFILEEDYNVSKETIVSYTELGNVYSTIEIWKIY